MRRTSSRRCSAASTSGSGHSAPTTRSGRGSRSSRARCCVDHLRAHGREIAIDELDERAADDTVPALDEALTVRDAPRRAQPGMPARSSTGSSHATRATARSVRRSASPPAPSRAASRRCLGQAHGPSCEGRNAAPIHVRWTGDPMTTYDEERIGELLRAPSTRPRGLGGSGAGAAGGRARGSMRSSSARSTTPPSRRGPRRPRGRAAAAGVEPSHVVVEHLRRRLEA